jgi:thiamine transport system ATP-binding protein
VVTVTTGSGTGSGPPGGAESGPQTGPEAGAQGGPQTGPQARAHSGPQSGQEVSPQTRGLEVQHLDVRYDDLVAVDDVSLAVPPGEMVAVLGPSGCGKSTLLRAVAGLEPPSAGRIRYDGHDLARVPAHRRGFGLMFQDGQLFPHLDVAGNVAYPLRIRRSPGAERRQRVGELLELVGLAGHEHRSPEELSGGQRQRVALARALAVRPRLLLLDEPLASLDRDLRERLAGDLARILRAEGTSAVLVTHDAEEAFTVADRMAVMRAGRLVQQGTLEEVWRHPADAGTAQFLGYARVLSPETAARLTGHEAEGALALRRSALRVAPEGEIAAEVCEVRAASELTRLVVDVSDVGRLDAVASWSERIAPGDRVRLSLDPERTARLG